MLRVLIVGQGLAGSWLAWVLHHRGHQVLIAQDPAIQGASRMAAGLINPITGMRWVKTWRADAALHFCEQSYQSVEAALSMRCYAAKTIMRFLRNATEWEQAHKRFNDPEYRAYLGAGWSPGSSGLSVEDPYGGCSILGGATVRVPLFLDAIRGFFEAKRLYLPERLDYSALQILAHGAAYAGDVFDKVIFCEGAQSLSNPWFPASALKPSQGEILTIRPSAMLFPDDQVLLRQHWLTPWSEGTYRLGATYSWDLAVGKTLQARDLLLAAFRGFFPHVPVAVVGQDAAIRPNSADTRPILGFHPQWSALGFMNGLGSKGSLLAPYLAQHLCEVLEDRVELDPEVDMRRFLT
ncbi:MAG TPA: FAD-dependent oxidoreductase [Opitutales bacterium]|nr:FAD-dependent oxidoreductase [Opitutales bacterium]